MSRPDGWDWFQPRVQPTDGPDPEIRLIAKRCLSTADGALLLAYLRAMTIERQLAPDVSDAVLRHLEGQRALVRHLELLGSECWSNARPLPQTAENRFLDGNPEITDER